MEESDIIDLEKRYWLLKAQSRTGRFDLETFGPLVSPPIRPSLSEGRNHYVSMMFLAKHTRPAFISNQYIFTLKGHNVIGLQVSCKS